MAYFRLLREFLLSSAAAARIIVVRMLLSALVLLSLNLYTPEHNLAIVLIGLLAFLLIGPYSFLAGAILLDFGGKKGSGTAFYPEILWHAYRRGTAGLELFFY